MSAFTCISPNCPVDCCMCVKAIPPDDEPRQIILALLTEFATDGHGAPFEDGEHSVVDRARKYLCRWKPGSAVPTPFDASHESAGVDALRRSLGEALTLKLAEMTEQCEGQSPDWFDARHIDEVLDVLMPMVATAVQPATTVGAR